MTLRSNAIAFALVTLFCTTAFADDATCDAADACPGMSSATDAYNYLNQQKSQAESRQRLDENSTSQRTGPTATLQNGTPTVGYRWSVK
jgi:hypothetical protein